MQEDAPRISSSVRSSAGLERTSLPIKAFSCSFGIRLSILASRQASTSPSAKGAAPVRILNCSRSSTDKGRPSAVPNPAIRTITCGDVTQHAHAGTFIIVERSARSPALGGVLKGLRRRLTDSLMSAEAIQGVGKRKEGGHRLPYMREMRIDSPGPGRLRVLRRTSAIF